jgi:hypothetical protein
VGGVPVDLTPKPRRARVAGRFRPLQHVQLHRSAHQKLTPQDTRRLQRRKFADYPGRGLCAAGCAAMIRT